MRAFLLIGVLFLPLTSLGQWKILDGGTTADLRGVDYVGKGTVWVSGTGGTVLRSDDDGATWKACAVPAGAEKLDFRGVQAFDNETAIVMSSGPGDASRLYKTTDGCQTWKLVFTNPDKDGFWDAFLINRFDINGYLIGDPVKGSFRYWQSSDKGETWQSTFESGLKKKMSSTGLEARPQEGAFAASNSSLFVDERFAVGFITGGPEGSRFFVSDDVSQPEKFRVYNLPLASGSASTGGFAIGDRDWDSLVAVGGNYDKPSLTTGTAAFSHDGGHHWNPASTPPHGYRSAVAYDEATKAWITVGPNGTDVSTDDGRNWRAVKPDMSLPGAQADEDAKWNALSLPFVVGPKGRIGRLRSGGLGAASR